MTNDCQLLHRAKEMSDKKAFFSLLPRRPPVTTDQAVTMATQLFNLHIEDATSVKELYSYDDRNFFMRGSLMREEEEVEVSGCKEYILKILNHVDSSHECLTEVQCNTMLFLQSRGYHCPVPVPSIRNTYFVKCKIPRSIQPRSVALETDGVTLETEGAALKNDNVLADTNVSFESAGILGSGIEVYDGKEYSEKKFFVCDVRLLTFVPGKVLNEIPLNTELLFNAGMAVGRLDRDLEDFPCPKLDRPGFAWGLSDVVTTVGQLLEAAVTDQNRSKLVREVCESFKKEVAPKLHLLPKQTIHADANNNNIIVTPDSSFGFIDFGDINYSCRIFELAISLMYILNIADDLSCGNTRMAGHFFAGYYSVNPLTGEELELLHVLVAARFCQSLVIGAYSNKYLDPDNEYLLESARNGWKNLEAFWKLPKEEVLKTWREIGENIKI